MQAQHADRTHPQQAGEQSKSIVAMIADAVTPTRSQDTLECVSPRLRRDIGVGRGQLSWLAYQQLR